MSPGSNKRPTGAVPKSKPSKKNAVPQEMVAPTRRDLQEHLNEFFASVAERAASKPDNLQHSARTPADTACFDLDNIQENTRFCWPVRPIPRRNFLHEDMNDLHITGQSSSGSNAAIGVVIPTTPNSSSLHHQQQPHNNQQQQQFEHLQNAYISNNLQQQAYRPNTQYSAADGEPTLLRATVSSAPSIDTNSIDQQTNRESIGQASNASTTGLTTPSAAANLNIEERLSQIQEYIKITSTLINSIQSDKSKVNDNETIEDLLTLEKNLDNLKDSEQKLSFIIDYNRGGSVESNNLVNNSTVNTMVNDIRPSDSLDSVYSDAIMINSNSLENVSSPTEPNGPRPQSVASIHSTIQQTPSYDDLHTKLEASSRNMLHIKEQQQQLLRLQQTAKHQLHEMENLRANQPPMSFNGTQNGTPDYDNVEDVQSDVTALMGRMKSLTDYINNHIEYSAVVGDDKGGEGMEERLLLQRKLAELKNKKQQIINLVSELQSMNDEQQQQPTQDRDQTPTRNVPIEYERIVPIELVPNSRSQIPQTLSNQRYVAAPIINNIQRSPPNNIPESHVIGNNRSVPVDNVEADDADEDDDVGAVGITSELLNERSADIISMKNQLKRLKDMMQTVKLIEQKNGDCDPEADDVSSIRSSRSQSQDRFGDSSKVVNNVVGSVANAQPTSTEEAEEEMGERVRVLHSMTADLKLQAISLAAERDRLKDIKNEMARRRDVDSSAAAVQQDKNKKQNRDQKDQTSSAVDVLPTTKSEYEAKKIEFENLVKKLEISATDPAKSDKKELGVDDSDYYQHSDNWRRGAAQLSSSSSLYGGQFARQSAEPLLPKSNQLNNQHAGKDSTDSGAADVLGMSAEAGSIQSGSSRGFSVPPPMRNMGQRDGAPWRKTSQETSRISSINQQNPNYNDLQHDSYPWYYPSHGYYNNQNNYGPQSPHCHFHHHHHPHPINPSAGAAGPTGSGPSGAGGGTGGPPVDYNCRAAMCYGGPSLSHATGTSDPVLLQQFIQTQQMLINSVCQCNQLLWDQQREINNLNSAVLLLQERILNTTAATAAANGLSDSMQTIRAESVPPNVTCNNSQPFLPRAQSEQPPLMSTGGFPSNGNSFYNHQQNMMQSYRQYQQQQLSQQQQFYGQQFPNQSLYNRQHSNATANNHQQRSMRFNNQNNLQSSSMFNLNQQHNCYQNENNSFLQHPPAQQLNNDLNSTLQQQQQQQHQQQSPQSPPIFIHHQNNTTPNNNTNNHNNTINNQLHQQPSSSQLQQLHQQNLIAAALNNHLSTASNTTNNNNINQNSNSSTSTNNSNLLNNYQNLNNVVPPALNNQVPPGNRANNYWDNFRSYSRQNLLSTTSCKSNEEACGSGGASGSNTTNTTQIVNPINRDQNNIQQQLRGGNQTPQMTHNNLPIAMGSNKYLVHFRNQINQQQNVAAAAAAAAAATTASSTSAGAPPDVLNINQHFQQQLSQVHQPSAQTAAGPSATATVDVINNFNNLNVGTIAPLNQQLAAASLNFNVNLELNELKPPKTTKMLPKSSTGGNKRIRHQIREREQINLSTPVVATNQQSLQYSSDSPLQFAAQQNLLNQQNNGFDLNLATTAIHRQDSKSTDKPFEALKENVYLEVSALIAANESRPHFLINLFRELQLISSSDPLRNRLMQAFQELYNRYCDPTDIIQEESSSQSVQNDASSPENLQQHESQSSNNRFNQSVEFPSTDKSPVRGHDPVTLEQNVIPSILHQVNEFLQSIEHINDSALERIANIVAHRLCDHENDSTNKSSAITLQQIYRELSKFDRDNNDLFMKNLESYFIQFCKLNHCPAAGGCNWPSNGTSVNGGPTANFSRYTNENFSMTSADNQPSWSQPQTVNPCKSNEAMSVLRKRSDQQPQQVVVNPSNNSITLADYVAIIGNGAADDENDEDLAEADQICGAGVNDDNYSAEDDFNNRDVSSIGEGAVGGVVVVGNGNSSNGPTDSSQSSTLPDLAKVTATTSEHSLDEESIWMANEEVERITGPPKNTDTTKSAAAAVNHNSFNSTLHKSKKK